MPPAGFELTSTSGRTAARPLGSAVLTFSNHKIKFGTQFCSPTVQLLEMYVRQLCTKVEERLYSLYIHHETIPKLRIPWIFTGFLSSYIYHGHN